MGKHDKTIPQSDKTIPQSSEEFYRNRIERLEAENADLKDRLAFSQETICKLQEQCSRMSKWASEIEAGADDKITELEAENAKLRGKIVKLVENYV